MLNEKNLSNSFIRYSTKFSEEKRSKKMNEKCLGSNFKNNDFKHDSVEVKGWHGVTCAAS